VNSLRRLNAGTRVLIALAVAGAAFGIATAVQAAIPSSNGVIHGCYQFSAPNTSRGVLRVINAENGEPCRFNEHPLNWNQSGPTGPTGPTGPRGPTGPTGPGGFVSLSRNTFAGLTAGEYVVSALCPSGTVAGPVYAQASVASAYTQRDNVNNGMAATGTPDNTGTMHFGLSVTTNLVLNSSCADQTAYGLARPNTPPAGTPKLTLAKTG
jgi:hypothetical protein